jgi:hypothetical protein
MAIFFTSDTHFGHAGALALYRRPFASVAAMDEGLVERWNETGSARGRGLASRRFRHPRIGRARGRSPRPAPRPEASGGRQQ